jgi:hypothetical protein
MVEAQLARIHHGNGPSMAHEDPSLLAEILSRYEVRLQSTPVRWWLVQGIVLPNILGIIKIQ